MSKTTAVMIVRNEQDLIGVNLEYHADQGVSEFRIVDNGSTDATLQVLRALAPRLNVLWTRNDGPYHQADIISGLARDAFEAGADWILPVDADEFWSAGHSRLVEALEASTAGAVGAEVVNFIQDRRSRESGAGALLTMTYRTPKPQGPPAECRQMVERGEISFVEMEYARKWIPRASADLRIEAGAHQVSGVKGPCVPSAEIACLHAPMRSRAVLEERAAHGRRLIEAGYPPDHGWQNQRLSRLHLEGELDEEWEANSAAYGCLELGGGRKPLVFDSRLRDAVSPWIADQESGFYPGA